MLMGGVMMGFCRCEMWRRGRMLDVRKGGGGWGRGVSVERRGMDALVAPGCDGGEGGGGEGSWSWLMVLGTELLCGCVMEE